MTRANEYRRNAEEAERMAARALSGAERAAFLKVAQGWRDLERQAGPRLGPAPG